MTFGKKMQETDSGEERKRIATEFKADRSPESTVRPATHHVALRVRRVALRVAQHVAHYVATVQRAAAYRYTPYRYTPSRIVTCRQAALEKETKEMMQAACNSPTVGKDPLFTLTCSKLHTEL